MGIAAVLIQELEAEARTTRRVLERVPEGSLGWRPHEKSMTLGQLARHVATTPGGVAEAVVHPAVPLPKFEQPTVAHASELVPMLDDSVA